MVVIGIDDTDSATAGMCTTYVGTLVAERLPPAGTTTFLVRLNPAIEYKTRGNGAVAVHSTASRGAAVATAETVIETHARMGDPETNPGLVAIEDDAISPAVTRFAVDAIRDRCRPADATAALPTDGVDRTTWGNGRGVIGATAAVGAVRGFREPSTDQEGVFADWTAEYLAYRRPSRWGTERDVDPGSVRTATANGRPRVWDNIDPVTGKLACVPHTPCPVLFGIRGEDPPTVTAVADGIDSEPRSRGRVFLTNQATDAHLRPGTAHRLRDGRAYRIAGTVGGTPENRPGGHVRVRLANQGVWLACLAFEPTKRFREQVRRLRSGDRIIACGEIGDGTLKLEKFAMVDPVRSERVTPTCPTCDRRMKSAGRGQGYRCRSCGTNAARKVRREVSRTLAPGWYEVPPTARRHLSKPVVREGHRPGTPVTTDS